MQKTLLIYISAILIWFPQAVFASTYIASNNPYLNMSIEDLMQVPVSVASKKAQALSDTAAAVFVLTSEDIRKSGATSLPEVLRLVPGVEVARIDGHSWAVSARGFMSGFSGGLLVMVDGRSVFTPMFAGVYWDVQNVMLEDVDKIEVVRGSGGAVWGANAVNGVINIITKSSSDTQGGLLVAGVGDNKVEKGFSAFRYGFKIGENASARVFAKGFSRNDENVRATAPTTDWQDQRVGFRADWELNDSSFMLDSVVYQGHESTVSTLIVPVAPYSELVTYQSELSGGHLLASWQREGLSVQTYFDRTTRKRQTFTEYRDTSDFEVKYHTQFMTSHDLQLGLGYRKTSDQIINTPTVSFAPSSRTDPLYSAFIQDEVSLTASLVLTLGLKVEHNNYSGYERAPSIRMLWKATDRQRLWASVSRAYQPPSRADYSMSHLFVSKPTFKLGIVPNQNLKSTKITSYELGYRFQPKESLSLELAAYQNEYHDLTSNETSFDPVSSFLSIQSGNFLSAKSKGVEMNVSWQVMDAWRLKANYSWAKTKAKTTGGNDTESVFVTENNVPNHRWALISEARLSSNVTLDTQYYVVAESLARKIDAYERLDTRLAWQQSKKIELSLAVQNVLGKKHAEFPDFSGGRAIYGRSYYAKATWEF